MGWLDYVLLSLVAAGVIFALIKIRRNRGRGCNGCNGCDACQKRDARPCRTCGKNGRK